VFGSALTTTALPSARAGAIERMPSTSGKFQGRITPTVPIGTRWAIDSLPSVGITSPRRRGASDAASRHSLIASPTSKSPLGWIAPPSRTSQSAISARWRSSARAASISTSARS
jgi:hypothetical protein